MQPPPPSVLASGGGFTQSGSLTYNDPEAEELMARMMMLVLRLTKPEKNKQGSFPSQLHPRCRTVYINNLNEKVPIQKLHTDLRAVCAKFGKVEHFSALTSFWRRGQVFVTYEKLAAAEAAVVHLQGVLFEGKPMRLDFARRESQEAGRAPEEEAPGPELANGAEAINLTLPGPQHRKPLRIRERERALQAAFLQLRTDIMNYQTRVAEQGQKRKAFSLPLNASKRPKLITEPPGQIVPNRVLFCENLSETATEADLMVYFDECERVRLIPAKQVAFVDFKTVEAAIQALEKWQGKLPFKLTYAKR